MKIKGETVVVTGAAGFIGSQVCEDLLNKGCNIIGVDKFTDYYDSEIKWDNIQSFKERNTFELVKQDIVDVDWESLLQRSDAVYHLAAQAGVRASWGDEFESYIHQNIRSTQVLLERLKSYTENIPLIMASSSSVYGAIDTFPMTEDMKPEPYSPYGVSKLAAENLGMLYHHNFDLPVTALRFFTVYGPKQRPDMAFPRFLTWIYREEPITVYGSGKQSRDFTFVEDIVSAMNACLRSETFGEVLNVGGGQRVELNQVLEIMNDVTGRKVRRESSPMPEGDVPHTDADTTRIKQETDWAPEIKLREGLRMEWEWIRNSPVVRDSIP